MVAYPGQAPLRTAAYLAFKGVLQTQSAVKRGTCTGGEGKEAPGLLAQSIPLLGREKAAQAPAKRQVYGRSKADPAVYE